MPNFEMIQARMKAAEADFAKISAIDLDQHNKKANSEGANNVNNKKMPTTTSNPWAGELKSKSRKKSSVTSPPVISNKDGDDWDEEDGEWEWEEEDEEDAQCNGIKEEPKDAVGKANIKIEGSLLTIDRSKPVDWSDEEFEEDDEETDTKSSVPAPPLPPPPPPMAPPAPPPPSGSPKKNSERLEALRKRPTKRPDWNDLMLEIDRFKHGKTGLLKKTVCNDRSQPMLSTAKVRGVFVYESEKNSTNKDIVKEIETGIMLKHVKCNDRSKPNLKGIKAFKRQLTKEEKLSNGFSFGDDNIPKDELEDVDKLRDDLESTKQLLELEVRSKQLLEKDYKRLQHDMEKMRAELEEIRKNGGEVPNPEILNSILNVRKESIKSEKRKSLLLRCDSVPETEETKEELDIAPVVPEQVTEEVIEEMEELKEEVDEARRLAEEWEAKYKEMQRQMEDMEMSASIQAKEGRPALNRTVSTNSSEGTVVTPAERHDIESEEDWMQKREVHQLQSKLKNTKGKKEILVRERNLLTERIEQLKENIAAEYEARKKLKRDVKDMNSALKDEMDEIELAEQTAKELEDCYYGDDVSNLVRNTHKFSTGDDEEDPDEAELLLEEDELEETVDEILRAAEDSFTDEEDTGAAYFDEFKRDPNQTDKVSLESYDNEKQLELLSDRILEEAEKVGLMRKSNFSLKSKIDVFYDILQDQKEKHYDLKQELNRMLSDIQ